MSLTIAKASGSWLLRCCRSIVLHIKMSRFLRNEINGSKCAKKCVQVKRKFDKQAWGSNHGKIIAENNIKPKYSPAGLLGGWLQYLGAAWIDPEWATVWSPGSFAITPTSCVPL